MSWLEPTLRAVPLPPLGEAKRERNVDNETALVVVVVAITSYEVEHGFDRIEAAQGIGQPRREVGKRAVEPPPNYTQPLRSSSTLVT
jgi:hypothetical protein